LNQQGYTSVAIHGDEKEFWNRDRAFESMGFDKYISEEQFQYNETEGLGILDEDMFDQSILEIEKLKEPFYFFAITITSHMPFDLSDNLRELDLEGDEYTEGYLQSLYYTDKAFGEFYNNLKEKGYLENSAVIIYGDHEGIHKYYSTELPDNNKEIPFIVNLQGMEGMVLKTEGGQVDMMPTLAYMLGIDEDEYASNVMGRNLFNMDGGSPILSTGEIVGAASNETHLLEALEISNMIIKGNYFGNISKNSIVGSK
jgi:phosphoglycerol transferase MdoB-like AlkP superfamily enzyme